MLFKFNPSEIGKKGSYYQYVKLRQKLQPVINALKALKAKIDVYSSGGDENHKTQSEVDLALETVLSITTSRDAHTKRIHESIYKLMKNNENDMKYKMKPDEAAAMRKQCNLSVYQVESIRRFLEGMPPIYLIFYSIFN